MAEDPRPPGSKKLKGEQEYLWRIRVGDYRVIYQIEEHIKGIEVRKVGHRKTSIKANCLAIHIAFERKRKL